VKDLLTNKEITLLAFVLGGLAIGFALSNFNKIGEGAFPQLKGSEQVVSSGEAETERVAEDSIRSEEPIASGPVDINHASEAELRRISGVGPVLAQRIIEDRRVNGAFESPDEILRVKGIGAATLEKIKKQIIIVK